MYDQSSKGVLPAAVRKLYKTMSLCKSICLAVVRTQQQGEDMYTKQKDRQPVVSLRWQIFISRRKPHSSKIPNATAGKIMNSIR